MASEKSSSKKRRPKVPRSYLWKKAENATQESAATNKLTDLSFTSKISEFVFCNRGYGSVAFYAVILLFIAAFIYTIWKIVSPHSSSRASRRPGSSGVIKISPTAHAHIGAGKSENGNAISGVFDRFHQAVQHIRHQVKEQDTTPTRKSFPDSFPSEGIGIQNENFRNQFNPILSDNDYRPVTIDPPRSIQQLPVESNELPYQDNTFLSTVAPLHPWGPLVGEDSMATVTSAATSPTPPAVYASRSREAKLTGFDPYAMSPTRPYFQYPSEGWHGYTNVATQKPGSNWNNERRLPSKSRARSTPFVGEDPYAISQIPIVNSPSSTAQKFYKEIKYFGSEDPIDSRPLHQVKGVHSNDLKSFLKDHRKNQNIEHNNFRSSKYKRRRSGRKTRKRIRNYEGHEHAQSHNYRHRMSNYLKHRHTRKQQRKYVVNSAAKKEMYFNSSKRSNVKHERHFKYRHFWQRNSKHRDFKSKTFAGVREHSHNFVYKKHSSKHHNHHSKFDVRSHHYRRLRSHHHDKHNFHKHHRNQHHRHHHHQIQRNYFQHHHQQQQHHEHKQHHRNQQKQQGHNHNHNYYHHHHSNQQNPDKHNHIPRNLHGTRMFGHPHVIDYKHYQHFRRHHSVNDEVKGHWHSSKHKLRTCKTIRRFRTPGTVKVSRTLYRGNSKHLYTILACHPVRLRLKHLVHRHKHMQWKYAITHAQLCRKFWYVTNGKLQVKKETANEESGSPLYNVIICNRKFAPKLKLSNFKEVADGSITQFEVKKHETRRQNHLKKLLRKHRKHAKKAEILHSHKHRNTHTHGHAKKKHAHEHKTKKSSHHIHKKINSNNKTKNRAKHKKHHAKSKKVHSKKEKLKHKAKAKTDVPNSHKKKTTQNVALDKSFFSKLLKVITSAKEGNKKPKKQEKQKKQKKSSKSKTLLDRLTSLIRANAGIKNARMTKKSDIRSTKRVTQSKSKKPKHSTKSKGKVHSKDNDGIQKLLARILPSVVKSVKANLKGNVEQLTKKIITTKPTTRPTTKPTTTKPKSSNLSDIVKNLLPLILKKAAQVQQPKTPPTTKSTTPKPTTKPTTPPKKATALEDLLSRLGLSGINLNNLKGSVKPARNIPEKPTRHIPTVTTTTEATRTTLRNIEAPNQPVMAPIKLPMLPEPVPAPPQTPPIQIAGSSFTNYQNPQNPPNYNQDPYQREKVQKNILCFGDSLTAGYMNRGEVFHPYSIHLSQLLNANSRGLHYSVITKGKMREMAHGSMNQRLPMVLGNSSRFDWVIILGGTNDVAHVKNFGDDDSFMGQLVNVWSPRIVKDIEHLHETAHRYGARTVMVTIPESAYETWSQFKILLYMRKAINIQLRKYASQSQGQTILCDMARYIPRLSLPTEMQAKIWSDHLHLTAYGYDLMAQFLYKCMKPYLQ